MRTFAPRDEGSRNSQRVRAQRGAQGGAVRAVRGPAAFLLFPEADVSFPECTKAANALLMTLEEPRPNVCFILLSERPDRLLVTIRSRCQRLRFGRLPELVLQHILESSGAPQAQWEAAIALCDGQADRALELIKDGTGNNLLERALRIEQALGSGIPGRMIQLSEELAKAPDCLAVLDTLGVFYRDVAASALGMPRSSLRLPSAHEESGALGRKLGPERAARKVQRLAELPDLVRRNANLQIVLDHLLIELSR